MSITQRYIKIQRENEQLKKLLGFVCKHLETGDDVLKNESMIDELFSWWEGNKKLSKIAEKIK